MIRNLRYISVGSLFGENNVFVVPRYQRGYAWELEQVNDFCQDIKKCFDHRRLGHEPHQHFFGGLVCVEQVVPGAGRKEYSLIDGQQRIASFVIFASRLILKYKSLEQSRRAIGDTATADLIRGRFQRLVTQYCQISDEQNRQQVLVDKLTLSNADNVFYKSIIANQQLASTRSSHDRLLDAIKCLDALINSSLHQTDIDQQLDELECYKEVLNDDCNIILITTEQMKDAYKLFQVLNDRGISLTEGDLLRAKTLELLEKRDYAELQSGVASLWDEILSDSPSTTEDYLSWYYAAIKGKAPARANLFDDFMMAFFSIVNEHNVTNDEAENINTEVNNLYNGIIILRKIFEGEWPYQIQRPPVTQWDRQRLSVLVKELAHTNCIPLLFAAHKLQEREFSKIVHVLEKFVFRYRLMCKQHIGSATSLYLKHALKIMAVPPTFTITALSSDLQALIDNRAPDDLFKEQLKVEMKYSNTKSNKYLKYFLITLEEYWRSLVETPLAPPTVLDKSRVYDQATTTIEHIYPQNAVIKNASLEPLINNLGNLSILGPNDNVNAANDDYVSKRPLLENTSITLNKQLALNTVWSDAIINAREDELVQGAAKIFKV